MKIIWRFLFSIIDAFIILPYQHFIEFMYYLMTGKDKFYFEIKRDREEVAYEKRRQKRLKQKE